MIKIIKEDMNVSLGEGKCSPVFTDKLDEYEI